MFYYVQKESGPVSILSENNKVTNDSETVKQITKNSHMCT